VSSLTRDERLKRRDDFVRIQSASRVRVRSRSFVVLACPRAEPGPSRLGVVASRSNRSKRLLRELYRHNKAVFGPGIDVLLIAQPPLAQLAYAELAEELARIAPDLARRLRTLAEPAARDQAAGVPSDAPAAPRRR
jgi:ribonuclease P protein component